jgi:hypothetical protein
MRIEHLVAHNKTDKKIVQYFSQIFEYKRLLEMPRYVRKDNIKKES